MLLEAGVTSNLGRPQTVPGRRPPGPVLVSVMFGVGHARHLDYGTPHLRSPH